MLSLLCKRKKIVKKRNNLYLGFVMAMGLVVGDGALLRNTDDFPKFWIISDFVKLEVQ